MKNRWTGITRVLYVAILTCLLASAGSAANGKVVRVTIPAPSLKGNLLGDPDKQPAAIYLPPGYGSNSRQRYPTLYLLHGFTGSQDTFVTTGEYMFNLTPMMDELMSSGKIRKMIVVMPNGTNAYHGSFYTNSRTTGKWEDFITKDVVSYVDRNYRTLPGSSHRGLAGHSMGGYGAVWVGMRNPKVFSVVYALSPAPLGFAEGDDPTSPIWGILGSYKKREDLKATFDSKENLYANLLVALAGAFAPNPKHPPFLADFPFVVRNGKVVRDKKATARWHEHSPVDQAKRYRANLRSLRGIALDYGKNDEFRSVVVNVPLFSKELKRLGIRHQVEMYDGNHEDHVMQRFRTKVFPFFSSKLAK